MPHIGDQGAADGRWRWARAERREPAQRRAKRSHRLRRTLQRRPVGVVCVSSRSRRRGLRTCRRGDFATRRRVPLPRVADSPQCLARPWRHRAALERGPLQNVCGAPGGLRAAVGARTERGETPRCVRKIRRRAISRKPARPRESGDPGAGIERLSAVAPATRMRTSELDELAQYRLNRPTSLPWMRTRLGGKIRTS